MSFKSIVHCNLKSCMAKFTCASSIFFEWFLFTYGPPMYHNTFNLQVYFLASFCHANCDILFVVCCNEIKQNFFEFSCIQCESNLLCNQVKGTVFNEILKVQIIFILSKVSCNKSLIKSKCFSGCVFSENIWEATGSMDVEGEEVRVECITSCRGCTVCRPF